MFNSAFNKILLGLILLSSKGVIYASASTHIRDYEQEEKAKYETWKGRYLQPHELIPDASSITSQEYEQAFSKLNLNTKPLASRGEVYFDHSHGNRVASEPKGENVAYVGPNHMNYVQRDEEVLPRYEAFGVPKAKDPKIGHGAYARHEPRFVELYSTTQNKMVINDSKDRRKIGPDDTELVFDAGHGVDHAITVVYQGSNSTRDVRNFTPQNAYYNRNIRMHLVGEAQKKGFSYKELAIYGENPLNITRRSGSEEDVLPVPEGFVFFVLDQSLGEFVRTYYFPNFFHYKKEEASIPRTQKSWKYFARRYNLSKELAEDIWGCELIKGQQALRHAKWKSEHIGYRSLSGRYEVLPMGSEWPILARNALVRTAAIYRIERAAEFDTTTENMLQIAQIFGDKGFNYPEFEGTLHIPHLLAYWVERALKEVKRKGYPAEDIFYFMRYKSVISSETMKHLISSFEKKLEDAPNAEHVVKLLEYFDEESCGEQYKKWSYLLSGLVRGEKVPGSAVMAESNTDQLISVLSDTSVINIILDFPVTRENVSSVLEGFKNRAIKEKSLYERNLNFLEISNISLEALHIIFQAFEYGIKHNDEELFVDVRGTALKLPAHKKGEIKSYMKKKCPKTRIIILD